MTNAPQHRLPAYFIPHGGGPCFFMEWNPPHTWDKMGAWLSSVSGDVGAVPKAILLVSAHWEEEDFTVTAGAAPALIYDYHGFPAHTYELEYPAPGAPALAARVVRLLADAGLTAKQDAARGFDHGMFIPLKLMYPDAAIPVVQLSLKTGLDPATHIAAGRALAALRDEGVLIVGSGMSYHNLPKFFRGGDNPDSRAFDGWLTQAATAPQAQREALLANWAQAPAARLCHPREEHLLPLMVAAGAAGADAGRQSLRDTVMGIAISGYRFG
ncbi:MAG: class III extradiol ring-cleavage dioxygenase [Alphaproteobacteria bacterium]